MSKKEKTAGAKGVLGVVIRMNTVAAQMAV
jgi:hypothetical protein